MSPRTEDQVIDAALAAYRQVLQNVGANLRRRIDEGLGGASPLLRAGLIEAREQLAEVEGLIASRSRAQSRG